MCIRDRDQDATSHNARLRPARSAAEAPFNWIRIVPRRPSSSIVHSGTETARGVSSSTNVGADFPEVAFPPISRFSLPPSRWSSAAVRDVYKRQRQWCDKVNSTYKKHIRAVPRELFAVERLHLKQMCIRDSCCGARSASSSVSSWYSILCVAPSC